MRSRSAPAVGIAYSRAAAPLVAALADIVDYVEYPYELLACDEAALASAEATTGVLHCASLSLASGDLPPIGLIEKVAACAVRIESPWIGEHCSFVSVPVREHGTGSGADAERYDIGFAVCPPMNIGTVLQVSDAIERVQAHIERPLIIENAPIYFDTPGSTMRQSDVLHEIAQRTGVGLLLDLAHLLVTCDTYGLDPFDELSRFPLEQVVEAHLSGVRQESGVLWDDHASEPVPEEYELLRRLLDAAPVEAITHEYNWAPGFPADRARHEIEESIQVVAARC